jgi:hypothetical protein
MTPKLCSVIDIEASGFGRGSYPIEIGFVREDGLAWCSLISPLPEWTHWDPQAQQLHGISRESLQRVGRSPLAVAARLNQDLAGRTVYCDGWAHDYSWLSALFDAAGLQQVFRLESVNHLLEEPHLARLDALRGEAFGALNIQRHRASSDALALQWSLRRAAAPPPPAVR